MSKKNKERSVEYHNHPVFVKAKAVYRAQSRKPKKLVKLGNMLGMSFAKEALSKTL